MLTFSEKQFPLNVIQHKTDSQTDLPTLRQVLIILLVSNAVERLRAAMPIPPPFRAKSKPRGSLNFIDLNRGIAYNSLQQGKITSSSQDGWRVSTVYY
jgi:hypothetical protein